MQLGRPEQRIITEAVFTQRLMQQHTVADAVYLVEHLTVGLCYAQRTAEAASTLNLKLHVVQQQVVVVLSLAFSPA